MKNELGLNSPLMRHALTGAVLMMAWQVGAKAARDALFLSSYRPSALPAMIGGAAVCSILMALLSSRLMVRRGPSRLIPYGYLLGGVLHIAEWILLPRFPKVISAFLYVHVIALGSVILSGYWALVSERFDPREARKRFGQIAAFGTVGSLVGGLIAERVAALTAPLHLLLLLAILQIACSLVLIRLQSDAPAAKHREPLSIPDVISGAPYLLQLALFILLLSMSAATLDYLFKSQSVARFGRGPELSRFFALFYSVISVLTFAVQAGLTRWWLSHFGPGRTVAVLPVAVTGASLVSLMFPGPIALTISRGIEQLFRGSLFRSGYELFFNPMPDSEKRSAKSVIDIGADRLGDGLAAAAIQLLLTLPAAMSGTALLLLTAVLSGLGIWISFRLDRAYVTVLEHGLEQHTVTISSDDIEDAVTRTVLLRTQATVAHSVAPRSTRVDVLADPLLWLITELSSGEPARIMAVLRRTDPLPAAALPKVIELLGNDRYASEAHNALERVVDRAAGQLGDALGDPAIDLKARRRLPRILAESVEPLSTAILLRQLKDPRFEIRQRCARGLARICEKHPERKVDSTQVLEAVENEIQASRNVFRAQNLTGTEQTSPAGAVVAQRASQVIGHIGTMLGLIYPTQSIRLACRALESQDRKLRGVALEYLESILPKPLAELFSTVIEQRPTSGRGPATGTREDALAVLESTPSLVLRIQDHSPQVDEDS